jgi:hypothetical protein
MATRTRRTPTPIPVERTPAPVPARRRQTPVPVQRTSAPVPAHGPTEHLASDGTSAAKPSAADRVHDRHSSHVKLPLIGTLTLPGTDQLAYLGGIGALVVLGVVDWPVGALLGIGHLLASERNHRMLADFGEALEDA